MDRLKLKEMNRRQRARRARAKITGTTARPRLAVYVSNQHVIAQIIDDEKGQTLAYSSSATHPKTGSLSQKATEVGSDIAQKAKKVKIKQVIFDRGHRKYHGRLKALAEAARQGGLEF